MVYDTILSGLLGYAAAMRSNRVHMACKDGVVALILSIIPRRKRHSLLRREEHSSLH